MKLKLNWDGLGIATSIVCAIHCGILPLIVPILPLFGVNVIHNLLFEWGMITLAFLVGSYSLLHGYNKHHHTRLPILLFLIGFLFLIAKQIFIQFEIPFLSIAVVLIITAHYLNFSYCNRSKCDSPHHKH